jgi:WD40 repeat protein
VLSVAFSPNGRTLAAGDNSGDVRLWDTASGQETHTLSEGSAVSGVAFDKDGRTVAVADDSGNVGLWDGSNGQETDSFAEGGSVNSVAFSPDGRTLGVGEGGETKLTDRSAWDWSYTPIKRLLCSEVGRNMLRTQFLAYVPDQPYSATCSSKFPPLN